MGQMRLLVIGVFCVLAGFASTEELTIKSLPPSVVKTFPECGAVKVDAVATTQIKVTFSKEMTDKSWSWSQISDETFPKMNGQPKYLDDKKTCVIDVNLEPKKTYVIWLNSNKFKNFKDADGNEAVPYLLYFQTDRVAANQQTVKPESSGKTPDTKNPPSTPDGEKKN